MADPTQPSPDSDGSGADGLVGRDAELAVLRTLAAGARDGRAGVAVVQGGAGIGKTSLVDAWVGIERRNGMRVLRSTCGQTRTDFAFSLVRQLLAPVLTDADEKERAELLAGPAELAARTLGTDDGLREEGPVRSDASFALLHGLYWFLIHLAARGPLVIVVDDAHWCDAPSLRWISYITRRIEGLPVLLVLTERTGEDHPTGTQLTEIATQPDCRLIPLSPLTGPDVAVIVRAATDGDADDAFCRACEQASEGNPLLLVELLRTLVDNRVPPYAEHIGAVEEFRGHVLARTVLHRVGRQIDDTVELARALAILGDDTPTRVAAALSGLGASEVARHELVLRRIGVLHDDAPTRFRHPLIRTAIIEGTMTPDDLAAGSVRAARILHQEGASSEQVAAHLMHCEPGPGGSWPADVLRDAARVARHRGAPDAAVRYLQRALNEPLSEYERAAVLVELGTDELMLVPHTAVGRLRESLLIIEDPAVRGRVSAMLAAALQMTQRGPEAVTVLQQAVAGLEDPAENCPQRELLLHLKAQLIQVAYEDQTTIELVGPLIESVSPASLRGDTPGERAVLAASLIHAMAGHESAAHANELADRALRGGINLSGPTEMLFALSTLGLITTDRLQEAVTWYDQLSDQAIRCGAQRISIGASYGKASAASRQGRVVDALMQAQALLDRSPDLGYSTLPIAALIVNNLIELGDLRAAGEVLEANRRYDSPDAVWDRGPYLLAQGRWQLASGDTEAALETLLYCGGRQDAAGLVNPAVTAWRSQAALAYAALGKRQEAIEMATEELRLSRNWGTARMIGVSLRHLGLVTGGDAGFDLLGQAVDRLEDSPAPLELAKSLYDFGAAQLRAGDTRTARTTLRRSFDLAEECGATALSEKTRAALRTTGARPRRGRRQKRQPLTASEYQIAGMAATGHSNHQIAQALFVTPRAVETHLTSSYRKLGITGRVQLRDALITAKSPSAGHPSWS
ncbi:AAA family ATPase [Streptomyces sp. NPDC005407]|uniref:ATP-binding protein n=1 Tax=Streptomyces sp. NPDC005407 TaxID=3155340 RepID=UPI0033A4485A